VPEEYSGRNTPMSEINTEKFVISPKYILRKMLQEILEDHTHLMKYPKDCSCPNHDGPHAIWQSQDQLLQNYRSILKLIDMVNIPTELYGIIADIIAFGESERQRQSILIKDLKLYANDFMPRKKSEPTRRQKINE